MRTTIEISDEQRARLLELAARKGEKGFSKLVQAALDAYLDAQHAQDDMRRRALMIRGAFTDKDADQVRAAARDLRTSWR